MREMVEVSIQLNRDLANFIERALERNAAVRIGWGEGGDPKPRQGEMGVAAHLPVGARVRLLGNLAEMTAVCASGGNFNLEGEAGSLFGAWNRGAKLIVEKECASRTGMGMEDGSIICHSSVGVEAGAAMSGGMILIRGSAGKRAGAGMQGGTIVVMGDVASDVGCNMRGGRIIVNGRCPPPGEGATSRAISATEHGEINEILSEFNVKVDSDAVIVETDDAHPTEVKLPERGIDGQFETITLTSSGMPKMHDHAPLDLLTLLSLRGQEKGLLLPLPVIPKLPSGKGLVGSFLSRQPCLVESDARDSDFLLVSMDNLHSLPDQLPQAAGAVISLDDLPKMNDAELDALITICRSLLGDDKMVMLLGVVDRVSPMHRLAVDLSCDGVISDAESAAKLPAAAALPMVGLSAREHQLTRNGISQGLSLPWSVGSLDTLIAAAAGSNFVISDPFANRTAAKSAKETAKLVEEWLAMMDAEIRGWLVEIGEDGIDQLNRKHLRALDSDTANMTGIRLAGYDRPMPQWLGN